MRIYLLISLGFVARVPSRFAQLGFRPDWREVSASGTSSAPGRESSAGRGASASTAESW
jgi:hypothetical protein